MELQSYCINLTLSSKTADHKEHFGVLIPGPSEQDWKSIEAYSPLISTNKI